MHRYSHSGLSIASDIDLPEWRAFSTASSGAADVSIVLSDDPSPDYPADGDTFARGDEAGFCIEGVAAWRLEGGQRMTLFPSLAADPRELRLFTLGSAWGLLGYQRGHAMWHGSAVEFERQACLFCGAAGEGKSTMAAAMIAAGAHLVADDLSRVEPRPETAVIHPSSSRIKLWREAVAQFDWGERVVERDQLREDKFHCSVPKHHAGAAPLPLGAIVVLESGARLACDRLVGGEALTAVLAGTIYRPGALEAMGRWSEQGVLAARIVAQVPVWRLTRPRDLSTLEDTVELVRSRLKQG